MLTASDIANKYISFFQKRGHQKISNSPLVLVNDPTTLFTSSGMQPLVPYLLGAKHPAGERLVNVQNCFRAQDIDEIGDNRHTTFFRMLGNWSLGDYFKKEQLPWMFEFLTDKEKGLGLDPKRLYVTVFAGLPAGRQATEQIPKDTESIEIWKELFAKVGIDAREGERIFPYDAQKNWWSRAGVPDNMQAGEPGGPDSEVFYEFTNVPHDPKFGEKCHVNCDCGHFIEICNSVFMQYQKQEDGSFRELPQKNVDYGGGLERMLLAVENNNDVFQTSLFDSIIQTIELQTGKKYVENKKYMRIITDHFIASIFMVSSGVFPSNKEQGYILRRLIRRGLDNLYQLEGKELTPILESIIEQYKDTDAYLVEKYELIKNTILGEEQKYKKALSEARKFIEKKYPSKTSISVDDAFVVYTTHGLSPTQIKSLGYTFDDNAFAEKMKSHQQQSRISSSIKFRGRENG